MGEVYLAQDLALGRKAAIKVLPPDSVGDESAKKRLIKEARAAAILDHPNICPVYEVSSEGEATFIAMQYVEGETLSRIIERGLPTIKESIAMVAQVADALTEAHSHSIIHRDIKPQNIIVTPQGRVKVLDFGVAKLMERALPQDTHAETLELSTAVGAAVGTIPYMSPEQSKGQPVDGRSDLFSLGAVLYESVTGRRPFSGSNPIEICVEIVHSDPPLPSGLNPDVPPELERILVKALAKPREARYQSAGDMLRDLKKLGDQLRDSPERTRTTGSYSSRTTALTAPFRRWAVHARIPAAILALLLIAGVAVWLLPGLRRGGAHRPSPEAMKFNDIGVDFIRNGSYYQASKALEHSIELDNKYALAHARLAQACAEIDQSEKAKDELLLATSLVPNRVALPQSELMYLDAISATVRRDLGGAVQLYSEIAQQVPDSEKANAYLDLGRAYDKNEKLDKAIEAYLQVTKLDSQSPAAFLQLGILYGRRQQLLEAEGSFQRAEQIYSALANQEGAAEVLYQRGFLLNKLDRLAEARENLQKALEAARAANNKYQETETLLVMSGVSFSQGNTAEATQIASEAIESAQVNNLRGQATSGLIDLGNTYSFRGEFDEAQKYFKQALEFATNDKAQRGEARALLALGGLNVSRDNPDEAIAYLTRAVAFYQPAGYSRETSVVLTLLGRANRQKGEYEVALQSFQQQLQSAAGQDDRSQFANLHNTIGTLLGFDLERYPEALAHLDESQKIDESLGAKLSMGNDLMNRGRLLGLLGRYKEAGEALDQAFAIATAPEANSKQLQAWVHLARAQMALTQNRLPEAAVKGQQSLDLSGSQYKETGIQARYTLGLVRARSGAAVAGKKMCEDAIAMARDRANPRLLSQSLIALAEVLLGAGESSEALKAASEAQQRFARWGQTDSEWHAALIEARASRIAGQGQAAHDFASRADELLSSLKQKWDPETYNQYSARPDIQACRRELAQMLPASR